MKYDVVVLPNAEMNVRDAAAWWAKHRSELQSVRWLAAVEAALEQLENDAENCPFAHESKGLGIEFRQRLLRAGKHPTHRIAFVIRDNRVFVFAVRHLAQDDLTPSDLPDE